MDPGLRHLWSRLRLVNSEIAFARERLDEFAQLHRLATAQLPEYDFDDRREHQNQLFHSITSAYAKLRSTVMDLEPQRDQLRATINARLRPTQRPLNILDLPDELLMHIFAYARADDDDDDLHFTDAPLPGEAHDIKNLRLACRRFCGTSSHLLVRYLRVEITNPSSIQHLDQVSRHPTISKGIRGIVITLNSHDSTYADCIREFAAAKCDQLEDAVETWQDEAHYEKNPAVVERYQNAIADAEPILACWHHIAQHGLEAENRDHEPSRALLQRAHLQRAHDEYRRLYNEGSVLQAGSFVTAVVPALARMGTAMWLDIRDGSYHYEVLDEDPDMISLDDMTDPDLLCKQMVVPGSKRNDDGLAQPLVDVLLELLLASQQADIRLTGLKIWTLPRGMSPLPDESYLKLRSLVQRLKVLEFRPSGLTDYAFWQSKDAQRWEPWVKFLTALLDTSSIQRIDLAFDFLSRRPFRPGVGMGSVLTSRTWPKLRQMSLCIPFCIEDFKRVVAGAPRDMRLQLSGCLMNGSWVEVLDILKERGSKFSEICTLPRVAPQGQEGRRMTHRERMYVFGGIGGRYSNSLSRATMYIVGSEAYPTNPVQDWRDGKLAIQVPEGGNNGA